MSKYEVGQRLQVICESIDENGKAKFRVVNEDLDEGIGTAINNVKHNIKQGMAKLTAQTDANKLPKRIPVDISISGSYINILLGVQEHSQNNAFQINQQYLILQEFDYSDYPELIDKIADKLTGGLDSNRNKIVIRYYDGGCIVKDSKDKEHYIDFWLPGISIELGSGQYTSIYLHSKDEDPWSILEKIRKGDRSGRGYSFLKDTNKNFAFPGCHMDNVITKEN